MITELLYKWFGLDPLPCATCEYLRYALDESNRERRELLNRLLDKDKAEPHSDKSEVMKPIMPQFTPWRVRQQLLEQEDKKRAELLRNRQKEIKQSKSTEDLERELGVEDVSKPESQVG